MITPIARARLRAQQLERPRHASPADLVRWMGAVQAQDYLGSLWAVGQRTRGATEADVEAAIADRSIVRTWPMRGTLHFVPAADALWMVRLLAPRMMARAAGRHRALGLDRAALARARRIIERVLGGGRALTRGEAYAALERGGVSPDGQRGIHVVGHLAQEGLLCLGPRRGRQPTFVLLEEWVPRPATPSREQALAVLAERYFASHGPATLADFAWWSGLLVKDARAAIAEAGPLVAEAEREGRVFWSSPSARAAGGRARGTSARLLPAWDEYVVAYRDRADSIAPGLAAGRHPLATIGGPAVVIDGLSCGRWGRRLTDRAARVTVEPWRPLTRDERRAVEAAAVAYGRFLGRGVTLAAR